MITYTIKNKSLLGAPHDDARPVVVKVNYDAKTVTLRLVQDTFKLKLILLNADYRIPILDDAIDPEKLKYINEIAYYVIDDNYTSDKIVYLKRGYGSFPYEINRDYEAVRHLEEFQGKEEVDNNHRMSIATEQLASKLKYTLGIEYETSLGYLPNDRCVKDGLIPLRDGSITSCEYSTIVMDKNSFPLIYQQLQDLKTYCFFNKECALHMHFGGYPVDKMYLFLLTYVEANLECTLYDRTLPKYTFETGKYKNNHKDYCKKLLVGDDFASTYEYYVGTKFFGSLTQCHPADPNRDRKWDVLGRYYGLNLINMYCYASPKTVEFRFLRPTFNFRKIRYWIAVFNAVLLFCEKAMAEIGKSANEESVIDWIGNHRISLSNIIDTIYRDTPELLEELYDTMTEIRAVILYQEMQYDYWGGMTDVENAIIIDE